MRKTPLKRKTPLRRAPMRRKPRERAVSPDAVEVVHRRSGGRCEAGAPGCSGRGEHLHHIQPRRGGDHSPANLLDVCLRCHSWIHAHPAESYARGWLRRVGLSVRA